MKKSNKYLIFLFAFLLFFVKSFVCQPTCGNDSRLSDNNGYGSNGYQQLWDATFSPCHPEHFEPASDISPGDYPDNWILLFADEFNANILDKNYWSPYLPWGNDSPEGSAIDPNFSTVLNGKLIQHSEYIANPPMGGYPQVYDNGGLKNDPVAFPNIVTNYKTTAVNLVYEIPINCRVQGEIKIMDHCEQNWPAFWLAGANGLEIDIFEFTGGAVNGTGASWDDAFPNNWHKMTYHNKKYGNIGDASSTGVDYANPTANPGIDFSTSSHAFDLIWDPYKIQWWEDGTNVYTDYNYFKVGNSWTNSYKKHHYRENPIGKPSDVVTGSYVMNPFFPDNLSYSQNLIISSGVSNLNVSNYSPSNMETERVAVWIRSDCSSGSKIVSNLNWYNYTAWSGSAYETGYDVATDGVSNIVIPAIHSSIFAGANEVALKPGFSAESGSIFSAIIAPCVSSWDQRLANNRLDTGLIKRPSHIKNEILHIKDHDSIIYFNTLKAFSEINSFTELKNSEDHLTLSTTGELIKSIEVYDMQGRKMLERKNLESTNASIEKDQSWASGLYIIRVYSSTAMQVHRVWIR